MRSKDRTREYERRHTRSGWYALGEYMVRLEKNQVMEITLDGKPVQFYKRTNRCGGDGFEPWPEPVKYEAAYRRLHALRDNWRVGA